jgi:hypothetical protein
MMRWPPLPLAATKWPPVPVATLSPPYFPGDLIDEAVILTLEDGTPITTDQGEPIYL